MDHCEFVLRHTCLKTEIRLGSRLQCYVLNGWAPVYQIAATAHRKQACICKAVGQISYSVIFYL